MTITLQEVLTLVGRLDDAPGFDTPRERFRRFLTERVTTVEALRTMLAQCQEGLGDQHARARQDLIVMLGRFLGFDVTFGAYEPRGSVRLEGHWRSRRRARIVLEICAERTEDSDVDALSRTLAAVAATTPAEDDERWVGLCVTTPFYAARRRLEKRLAQRDISDVRCVTVESLLWLAEMVTVERLQHADVVRLLASGPDSDFMIELMRRLTERASPVEPTREPAVPPQTETAQDAVPPSLAVVDRRGRERSDLPETGFWVACLTHDENATPEQVLDSVIRRRNVLGISDAGPFPSPARPGDRVCFFVSGAGVVGHAQLESVVSDASAVLRGARRFGAVFRLSAVVIYDVPNPVAAGSAVQRIADRIPFDAAGAYLAPIARAEYELLTQDIDEPRASAC
jgi:hypothetical protein